MFSNVLLWLFVVFSGIAAGAGLFEMRVNVPRWFKRGPDGIRVNSEAMRTDDTGRRFWAFVTTGPLTLLTIASVAVAWNPQTLMERWWLIAAGLHLVERAGTLGYFIPNAVRLMTPGRLAPPVAQRTAAQWMRLNYVRIVLASAGWLAALRALSLTNGAVG